MLPPDYWQRFAKPVPREILKKLHGPGNGRSGSHVKVLAHPVGLPPTASEEIWLQICQVQKRGAKFVGIVNTVPGRTKLHGLEFGMRITFQAKHVIDVGMVGA